MSFQFVNNSLLGLLFSFIVRTSNLVSIIWFMLA